MKKIVLASLLAVIGVAGLITAFAVYFFWPPWPSAGEIQVLQTQKSPNGRWTAVVQLEVSSGSWASDYAVYAVRLKGPTQKDPQGDLAMNAEVAYPVPRPFIRWSGGKLVVTLLDHEKYQYFTSPISGVVVKVQRK